jgi:hypothetical protein
MDALPNFVIAGAPRCGTSAVFTYLAAHPEIAGSSVKEVQYFMDQDSVLFHPESNYQYHGLDGYRPYFTPELNQKPDAAIVFEATPGYLYQQTALDSLPTLPSRPRFLFQLRKPSAQVYSSYLYSLHQAGNLPQGMTFREFALGSSKTARSCNEFHRDALAFANYVKFLKPWHEACGPERIRISSFEVMRTDPCAYMRELADWLGVDPSFYDSYDFGVINQNVGVRLRRAQTLARRLSRPLSGRSRQLVRDLYRRVNTRSIPPLTEDDRAVLHEIDTQTQASSRELSKRFGLDIGPWT